MRSIAWAGGPRRQLAALAVVIAALGLAGCKGTGNYNDALVLSAPPGTELAVAPSAVTATSAPAAAGGPSAGVRAFCQDAAQLEALVPALFRNRNAATIAADRAVVARFLADAPKDLRGPAQVVAQSTTRVLNDLAPATPDLGDAARVFTDPTYLQSIQQVIAYLAAHC